MQFTIKHGDPADQRTGCAIVPVFEDGEPGKATIALDKLSGGALSAFYGRGDFDGKQGTTQLVDGSGLSAIDRVLLVGCGRKSSFDNAVYKRATLAALRALRATSSRDAISYLALGVDSDPDAYRAARIAAECWHEVSYAYSKTLSEKPARTVQRRLSIAVADGRRARPARRGARHGNAIGQATSFARELGNLPASVCTPSFLAGEARKLAKVSPRLTARIVGEPEMRKLGMGSLLSVTAGSDQPAKMLVLQYKGGDAGDAPTVLVGKGITFDSGGISLKPGPGMDEMKFDMCGAASVLGAMHATASLELGINLVVIVPACENLPNGRATKPGDVVRSMSGQTIEILNTDAEGRLILCDAITYAKRFNPARIIDVATLTGACVIALGKHRSGLMANSDDLADSLLHAGDESGDPAWRLPLGQEYMDQLRSNFADVANIGGREAGTITAGCFLSRFADGVDWAHLDIAGSASRGGERKGSTGRPVPMLMEYLLSL